MLVQLNPNDVQHETIKRNHVRLLCCRRNNFIVLLSSLDLNRLLLLSHSSVEKQQLEDRCTMSICPSPSKLNKISFINFEIASNENFSEVQKLKFVSCTIQKSIKAAPIQSIQ